MRVRTLKCKYCNNDSCIFKKDNVAVLLEPVEKAFRDSKYYCSRLKICINFNDYIIPIKYCPFCGRKMEEI